MSTLVRYLQKPIINDLQEKIVTIKILSRQLTYQSLTMCFNDRLNARRYRQFSIAMREIL